MELWCYKLATVADGLSGILAVTSFRNFTEGINLHPVHTRIGLF